MTLQEIANLKIEDYFYQLTIQLIPSIDPMTIQIGVDANGNVTYDTITLTGGETKPPLADYQAAFDAMIADLTAKENARLADIAARDAFKARVDALEYQYLHQALANLNLSTDPNPAIYINSLNYKTDDATLTSIETEVANIKAAELATKARHDKIALGQKAKDACDACLNIVRAWNIGKPLADIQNMKTTFSNVYTDLVDGMPNQAKIDIAAIPNDGVI
ncbi:MAG: hypothetical protein CUN55_17000, partial [Phototrophicales bacterium]